MSTTALTKVGTKNAEQVVLLDASGDQVTSFGGGTQYADGAAAATPTGTQINWNDGGTQRAVSAAKPLPVSVTGGGDASAANQVTGNASLASIDSKTPALGQALAAASVPVVLTAAQLSTLTPVSTVTANAGIDLNTSALALETTAKSIKTAVEILDNAIAGSEMQVDVVGALPAGNNNIGDVDVATLPAVHFQDVHVTGQGSQTALNQNVVLASAGSGSYDTLNGTTGISFRSVSLSIIPAAGTVTAGVISFEGSNDNTNFVATFLTDSANVTAVPVSTVTLAASTNRHFFGAIPFRYFRARISTGITGTTTGVQCFSVFSTVPFSSPRLAVTNATAASLLAQVNVASGGIASGAIAAGAITAGATSIATTEDTASAAGDHLVKVAQIRLDTPVSGANASASGDYIQFIADSFGKTWMAGSYPEDIAHIAGEPILGNGARRIDTAASSAGTSGDWATVDASAEGALWVTATPTTTSGLSVANFNTGDTYTALTNTAQVIKASAGNLYGYYIFNPNTSTAYVMVYNVAAASVTVGTTTALMVFAIPAGAAANLMFPYPISFSTAMSCAAATTGGGNTAPATALEVMIWYK